MTQHLLRARDEILEDLIERVADVDVAVGVRRAVVKDELGATLRTLAELVIEADLGPPLQHPRFHLRQACAHWKAGFRQEERFAPVTRIGLGVGH